MAEAIFNYEGINTSIQCNLHDKMKDIIANFLNKIKEKGDNFFYLYNGSEINKDLTFNDQANDLDKNRQKNYSEYRIRCTDISRSKTMISICLCLCELISQAMT